MRRTTAITLLAGTFVLALPSVAAAQARGAAACVTAGEQALALRDGHKLREARAQLQICSAKGCPAALRKDCSRRLELVLASIPTVVFDVKDEAGKALSGVTLSMDGVVIAEHLDARAVDLDPGVHTFRFELGGRPPLTQELTIKAGETDLHQSIVMPLVIAPPPAPEPASPPPTPAVAEKPAPPATAALSTAQTIGVSGIALGTAGLIFGTVYGVVAMSAFSAQKTDCGSFQSCPNHAQAVSDHSSAISDGTISTVGIVGGGILVAGGVALYFIGGHSSDSSTTPSVAVMPWIGPGGASVSLKGGF